MIYGTSLEVPGIFPWLAATPTFQWKPWQYCLEDVLAIQGRLDIVIGAEFFLDWYTLSNIACSTVKLTLLVELSIRYKDIKLSSKILIIIFEAYQKNAQAFQLGHILDTFLIVLCKESTSLGKSTPPVQERLMKTSEVFFLFTGCRAHV
ncbi:hypothetical protein VP01_3239g3 [Puccinia sorghi]|uniref:Uncharacterized protein n=1 Tax=Puccinia sorghi TaxID=27349 RepID=A0A0L6UYZ1_9BASI|nr:hypothetical protein VP01_3239g3 [Puccinia sorghi]